MTLTPDDLVEVGREARRQMYLLGLLPIPLPPRDGEWVFQFSLAEFVAVGGPHHGTRWSAYSPVDALGAEPR